MSHRYCQDLMYRSGVLATAIGAGKALASASAVTIVRDPVDEVNSLSAAVGVALMRSTFVTLENNDVN